MTIEALARRIFTRSLTSFSNLHRGESCYIFGDGPSIKWFDLGQFADHPAICCGVLPFHKDFGKLNVRYFTMVEPWLFVPRLFQPRILHGLRGIAAEYRRFVMRSPDKQFFVSLSNRLSLCGSHIHYVYRGLPAIRQRTDELLERFNLFAGSFHASLTLAYYLGFTKVYLVGFDGWTIHPARSLHWYELGEGEVFEATNLAFDFLGVLRSEMDICTISVDGDSKNVTNIRYEAHTGQAPRFRENHELLDKRYLDVLATYPGYRIFRQ